MQSSASGLCPAGSESGSLSVIDSSCLSEDPLRKHKLESRVIEIIALQAFSPRVLTLRFDQSHCCFSFGFTVLRNNHLYFVTTATSGLSRFTDKISKSTSSWEIQCCPISLFLFGLEAQSLENKVTDIHTCESPQWVAPLSFSFTDILLTYVYFCTARHRPRGPKTEGAQKPLLLFEVLEVLYFLYWEVKELSQN